MNAPTSRLAHCGGTDAAAIVCSELGQPYYRSSWEVWAERHAPDALPPREPVEQRWLDLGTALEAHVLRLYAERVAPDGLTVGTALTVHGPASYPWMRGQLDAPVLDAQGQIVGLVDAKTSRQRSHWFTDQDGQRVETEPPGYRVQVVWYLGLLRLAGHRHARFADLAALDLMSAALDVRTIEHDDDGDWGRITSIVVPWWKRHIIDGERPADDHSECCARWHLYCQPRAKATRPATDAEAATVLRWRELDAAAKAAEVQAKAARLEVLAAMDTERLAVGEGKAAPYVQLQAGPAGSRVLRAYRFPEPHKTGAAGEE